MGARAKAGRVATFRSGWILGLGLVVAAFGLGFGARFFAPGSAEAIVATDTLRLAQAEREIPIGDGALATAPLHRDVQDVSDAAEGAGVWAVLDAQALRVHILSAAGTLASFGRPGEGPGELAGSAQIAIAGDEVVVADLEGTRLDRFTIGGAWLGRTAVRRSGCAGGNASDLAGTAGGEVLLLLTCFLPDGSFAAQVVRVDRDGESERVLEHEYLDFGEREVDPLRSPLFAVAEGAVYLGVTPEACVTRVVAGGAAETALCHPEPRTPPLPDSIRSALQSMFAGRPLPLGARARIPDRYPPFRALAADGSRILMLRPVSEVRTTVELLPFEGPSLRIVLPEADDVHLGRRSVLVERAELEGTRIALIPLPGG